METNPAAAAPADSPRPWTTHYPPGIDWQVKLNLTPVHQQVLSACEKNPKANALDFLGGKTSFGELGKAIRAFAGALQAEYGVGKGARVALLLPNTPFYPIAYYGTLLAGGTVVNCNPLYTIPELTHIVSSAGADIVVTTNLTQIFPKVEALVQSGHVRRVICFDFPTALPPLTGLLYRLLKRRDLADIDAGPAAKATIMAERLLARPREPRPASIEPLTDVAVQQYTGGTTGLPRGAMLTHGNIAANMSQIDYWGCGLFYPPSKVVAILPFFHIFAMTVCMNVPLCNGTEVVMMPRFELKGFLKLMRRTRPNVLPAVPTLITALTKLKDDQVDALSSIDVVVSGGAPLPGETRPKFAKICKAILAEGYGLTEASPVVCCAALRVPSKPMSIGQPIPMTDVRLVDPDTGKVVGVGERGELQVRGPQVMLGYHNDPEATASSFDNGWLHSGDVAYMDEEGYFFIVDRIKDLIINGGFNVYPRVVEEAIIANPAVEEVSVIGAPDERRGEVPIAFVKLRSDSAITERELMTFLEPTLNKLQMPREIIFKDQLPKTLIGKLSKKELREEYAARKGKSREQA